MTARVVDDGGQGGVPVVFLHSLAGRASHWSSQLARLRTNRRALALELPGHGSAPPASDGDYSIEAMSRAGNETGKLEVQRAQRISVPAACLVIALFGAPLAMAAPRSGSAFGIGITPSVAAAPTRAGVAAGRDEVLERAVQVLTAAP